MSQVEITTKKLIKMEDKKTVSFHDVFVNTATVVDRLGGTASGVSSLAIPKIRSMQMVKQMFCDRGYKRNMQTVFDTAHNLWEIFTETSTGDKVMAVFADCKVFGDAMQIEEFSPNTTTETSNEVPNEVDRQASNNNKSTKHGREASQNTGMDFVKNIVKFALTQNFKIVILVTDFMTPHAQKYISTFEGIKITHFTYEETGIENMASHITQPIVFKALTPLEKAAYIKKNPRYKIELQRYSIDDALVKYYGMNLNDIIYIEDNDRQTGLVVEYAMVVEDL
jgi:hypothetical protein